MRDLELKDGKNEETMNKNRREKQIKNLRKDFRNLASWQYQRTEVCEKQLTTIWTAQEAHSEFISPSSAEQ